MSSHDESDLGHGNSPAAWTAVIIILIGFTVGTIAFFFDYALVVWLAAGVVVLGPIVGIVLARLDFGVGGSRFVPKDR